MTQEPSERIVGLSGLQKQLIRSLAAKPAVAAYLQQAKKWEAEGLVLVVWFDNAVSLNIVLSEKAFLEESIRKLDSTFTHMDIRLIEENTETVDLDDFDRQVDLIAQVFRGENIGEKK